MEPLSNNDERDSLIKLLQRALRSVPFVKLDSVEEVTELFSSALKLLEENLDENAGTASHQNNHHNPYSSHHTGTTTNDHTEENFSDDSLGSDLLNDERDRERGSGDFNDHRTENDIQSDLRAAQTAALATATLLNAANQKPPPQNPSSDDSSLKLVTNRALLGVTVTRDYSSPRTIARSLSLSGPAGSNNSLLSQSGGGQNQLPLAIGQKKQPGIGLGGNKSNNSIVPEPANLPQGKGLSARATSGSVGTALKNVSKLGLSGSDPAAVNSSVKAPASNPEGEPFPSGVAKPLPKNVLNRITASSKEFPSPKLGGRSLGSGSSGSLGLGGSGSQGRLVGLGAAPNSQTDSIERTDNDMLGEDIEPTGGAGSKNNGLGESGLAASSDTEKENSQSGISDKNYHSSPSTDNTPSNDSATASELVEEAEAEPEPDDLLSKVRAKGPLGKLRESVALPVTASPKQFRSSLALVTLAVNSANPSGSALNPDNGDTNINPAPVSSIHNASGLGLLAQSLGNSFADSGYTPSPKPAFLRRLDSPNTQYSKLMEAKSKIQTLINKAIAVVPRMKLNQSKIIRAAFDKAVTKLENSTTVPQTSNSDLVKP